MVSGRRSRGRPAGALGYSRSLDLGAREAPRGHHLHVVDVCQPPASAASASIGRCGACATTSGAWRTTSRPISGRSSGACRTSERATSTLGSSPGATATCPRSATRSGARSPTRVPARRRDPQAAPDLPAEPGCPLAHVRGRRDHRRGTGWRPHQGPAQRADARAHREPIHERRRPCEQGERCRVPATRGRALDERRDGRSDHRTPRGAARGAARADAGHVPGGDLRRPGRQTRSSTRSARPRRHACSR